MKKRFTAIALGVCLLATLFSGCSKSEKASKERGVEKLFKEITEGVKDCTKLGDYKGIKVEVEPVQKVTDDDVDTEINGWLEYYAVSFDGSVTTGQSANIDYKGTVDGQEFSGGSAEDYELVIGSGTFIPGFEEQLIDMKAGETKTVDVTFPADYQNNPDLSGKAAKFEVKVNNVAGKATLSDKWVEYTAKKQAIPKEDLSKYTVKDFKKFVKEYLQETAESTQKTGIRQQILTKLGQDTKFENVPEDIVNEYVEEEKSYQESNITSYYGDLQTYLTERGMTEDDYNAQIKEYAMEYLHNIFALKAVAIKEKIRVSEKEYEDYLQTYADNYGMETIDEFEKQYSEQYGNDLYESCLMEKVLDFLADKAKVTEKEATEPPAETSGEAASSGAAQ